MRCDLLLHGLLDLINALQPVHALIHLPWIGSDVLRTRTLLALQEDEFGLLSSHSKGKGKPDIIRVLE
jgi:hypothetical protein